MAGLEEEMEAGLVDWLLFGTGVDQRLLVATEKKVFLHNLPFQGGEATLESVSGEYGRIHQVTHGWSDKKHKKLFLVILADNGLTVESPVKLTDPTSPMMVYPLDPKQHQGLQDPGRIGARD